MHTSILVKYTCSLINCDVSVDVWMPAWVLGMVGEGHSWSSCTEDNRQLDYCLASSWALHCPLDNCLQTQGQGSTLCSLVGGGQ